MAGAVCACFSLFIAVVMSLLSTAADNQMVYIGYATCGTTIPIDSQWMLDPMWSFRTATVLSELSILEGVPETEMRVARTSLSDAAAAVVRSETGMTLGSVSMFEIDPWRHAMDDCRVFWNPFLAKMDGVVLTAVRLLAIDVQGSGQTCPSSTEVEVMLRTDQGESRVFLPIRTPIDVVQSLSLTTNNTQWPITFRIPPDCRVTLLLLTNTHGTIQRWYVWIPTTVFTGVVILLVACVLFVRVLPAEMTTLVLVLIFIGYLGSCVGLVMELLLWQGVFVCLFPFPNAITLYCCLPIFYLLLALILLLRHRHRDILFHAMLRLAVYGLNCGLCCGYWVTGYFILGSLTLMQFVLSNMLLSIIYAYFVVRLEQAGLPVQLFPRATPLLWFAPLVLFAPCVLVFYDLYVMDDNCAESLDVVLAVREFVLIYNAMILFPFLFLQNILGIALLATATVFHTPFVLPLFAACLLFGIHFVLSVEHCARMQRRWRLRGYLAGGDASECTRYCSCFSPIWPTIEQCVRNAHHLVSPDANNLGTVSVCSRVGNQKSLRDCTETPASHAQVEMTECAVHYPLSVVVKNIEALPRDTFWSNRCST